MNRNIKIVLAVSVFFGAATGIYEFVLPYYLKERGLSFESMATIFAAAAAGMLVLRVLMGRLADVWGRKLFYGLSLWGLRPSAPPYSGRACSRPSARRRS